MSYKYSFADNEMYGATDINEITKRLVTAGVEDSFLDGVAYNVSRFNEAGKLLYTSGVVPETCLTLKVVSNGEGKILINQGKAFFDDGAVIEIEAGGEALTYVTGTKNYVYLKNDLLNTNMCYPCCTTDEPTGIYVLLAEINEIGVITDRRKFARGKLPGYQSVAGNVMHLKETIDITVENSTSNFYISKSFDIGPNNFEYILAYREQEDGSKTQWPCLGIYDIKKNGYRSYSTIGSSSDVKSDAILIQNTMYGAQWNYLKIYATFELDENILKVSLKGTRGSEYLAPGTHSFDIDLILF